MGQAPATGRISLRTVPRNFPGRSGTREDAVYLCSPETAAASALTGVITDPRTLEMDYPQTRPPARRVVYREMLVPPPSPEAAQEVDLVKGPNIVSLPELDPLPDALTLPILLMVGDDISTDEIMPAGAEVLPFRSNIPGISRFVYRIVDETYTERAEACRPAGGHAVIGGENYGQGSSREHAALAPRYLGLRVVLARSFARIHKQNLANYGILPLEFTDPADLDRLEQGDVLVLNDLHRQLTAGEGVLVEVPDNDLALLTVCRVSVRLIEALQTGGLIRAANFERDS
jgi:aconitate hydratase